MNELSSNDALYRSSVTTRLRSDEQYLVFTARVLTVDYERKVLTIQDDKNDLVYQEVLIFPSNASAGESTDLNMPEPGTRCIACRMNYLGGFQEIAILSWMTSSTIGAIDAVATRGPEGVQGWTQRRRGTYRKAFPGQRTSTTTAGYSAKVDQGWDQLSSDFSRDRHDSLRRERINITGRKIAYSDSGLSFEGPVNRPPGQKVKSNNISFPTTLPDGSKQYTLFLNPAAALENRYLNGTQDVLPLTEKVEKVQEFALDYPVPLEVLETDLIDQILGTTQNPFVRTNIFVQNTVLPDGTVKQVSFDDETFMVNQGWDNPQSSTATAVGPTTNEGKTPTRRGFIIEKAEGTLVGSNRFDPVTFGSPLIPVLTPYDYDGRFGADFDSSYLPIDMFDELPDHIKTRMAASALSVRFPHEYNTTRWDVTKEGMFLFEIGSSIPQENITAGLDGFGFAGTYEYPHGAGRSVEGHLVGSLKMVIGKNRDEEDSIDVQALGQSVIRLGADDVSLPNTRRSVLTQIRSQNDAPGARELQYWTQPALNGQGDPVNLEQKQKGENVSLRGATDGGVVMRFGARTPLALRRHLKNGYLDAPGTQYQSITDSSRVDSKSSGRPTYGAGDSNYQFHNLANAGKSTTGFMPYGWSGTPVKSMDRQGLSIDFHTVRDILIRAGRDGDHGQSLLMDLAGGMVAWLGKDSEGRSMTASLDGGVEMTIGSNNQGNGLQLDIVGNLNIAVKGNYHLNVTGDYVIEANSKREVIHTDSVLTAQKIINMGLARITNEAPDIVNNQGTYTSGANS